MVVGDVHIFFGALGFSLRDKYFFVVIIVVVFRLDHFDDVGLLGDVLEGFVIMC